MFFHVPKESQKQSLSKRKKKKSHLYFVDLKKQEKSKENSRFVIHRGHWVQKMQYAVGYETDVDKGTSMVLNFNF